MSTLILTFGPPTQDLPGKVAERTIQFLREHITDYIEHTYSDEDTLLSTLKEHQVTVVLTTPDIPQKTALLIRSLHGVIITIGTPEYAAGEVDISIDALRPSRQPGLTGPAYLLPDILDQTELAAAAASMGLPIEDCREEMECSEATKWLPMIIRLVRKLDWDSEFFGFNVGLVSSLRLTPAIQTRVEQFIRDNDITLMEYLCDCHDRESILIAERAGFSFVDMRLTFGRKLQATPFDTPAEMNFRIATEADIPALRTIAHDAYQDSRYYFDGNFDPAKLIEFYESWAEKAVLGTFDHFAIVAEHAGQIVGFLTIRTESQRTVRIGLLGVHQDARGKGVGKHLLQYAFSYLADQGYTYIGVVTQGRNYAAQRLYQKSGFLTEKTELWYHKWR